jgi:beta-catenin-like protein 1
LAEVYKSVKLHANGDAKGKGRATVEDGDDDDYAGPEPPPNDVEEEPEDDEEGRFFGGGITKNTAEILDFMDEQDKSDIAVRNRAPFLG